MPAWEASAAALAFAVFAGFTAPVAAQTADIVSTTAFRVCADPAAYPMSTREGTGFENRLAEFFAEKVGRPLEYTWFPMATGFVRNTLRAKTCDVIIGYAQGEELVQNTNHYYTSAYSLVVPSDGPLASVETLGDPALQGLRLGIVAGSPPGSHMARLGLMPRAKPYPLVVDRRVENPAGDMLEDLAAGEIDAAVLWGPLAGPLVKAHYPDMTVIPLVRETLAPKLAYRITMGVRQGEKVWQRQLNDLIRDNQDEINQILYTAGVPLLNDSGTDVLAIE